MRSDRYLDVVILPPPTLARRAIDLSQRIAARYGSAITLDARSALPHISLYHIAIERGSEIEFRRALSLLAARRAGGELRVTGAHLDHDFGSLSIEISKPDWLRRLYLDVIHATHQLRDPDFDNLRAWRSEQLTAQQRAYIARYGTPLVGKDFIPHITLAALRRPDDLISASRLVRPLKARFKVRELHVCVQGPHHTVRPPLYAIPLQNAF